MRCLESTRAYDLYGLRLTVTAEPAVLDAIHHRLRFFAASDAGPGALSFVFRRMQEDDAAFAWPVQEGGRPVYETPAGEVLYVPATEHLMMTQMNRIRAHCDIPAGSVAVDYRDATDEIVWLLSHPFLTLPLIEILKQRGRYNLHAAGFCVNGRALLLPAASGAGKSTLALAFLSAGLDFLGDDLVFLTHAEQELRVLAFPDELDLTDETLAFFPELQGRLGRPRRIGWPKRQVWAEDVSDVVTVQTCRPGVLVFPQVGRQQDSMLRPLDRDTALVELLPNVLLTEPRAAQAQLDALAELVHLSACYRLEAGRDFATLPARLRSLLA